MNTREYLLTCLSEECAEIQHAVSKCLRFGDDCCNPSKNIANKENLRKEIIDLLAVITVLHDSTKVDLNLSDLMVDNRMEEKRKKLALLTESDLFIISQKVK